MAVRRKLKTAVKTWRSDGIFGLSELAVRKAREALVEPSDEDEDPFSLEPVFRYATCDDLIRLKAKYPNYCFGDRASAFSAGWGLKQVGTLFCADKVEQVGPTTILEVGVGYNTFFDARFGEQYEYWAIDEPGLYGADQFEEAAQKRRHTRFVQGLLGEFLADLPNDYFDVVFSVSVLEHVPSKGKRDVYRDMHRVTKPGGIIVHSIDLALKAEGETEHALIQSAGFEIPRRPSLRIRLSLGATLFEPLDIVFLRHYGVGREDMWTQLRSIDRHYPTVLVLGQKPQETST